MGAHNLLYFACRMFDALRTRLIGDVMLLPVADELLMLLWANPPLLLVADGLPCALIHCQINETLIIQATDLTNGHTMQLCKWDQTHRTGWQATALGGTFTWRLRLMARFTNYY